MSKNQDERARDIIKELLAGNPPPPDPAGADYGPWTEALDILLEAHRDGGHAGVRQAWQILARTDPDLVKLYASDGPPPLEGATAMVRRLLAVDSDTPVPNIDDAHRLADLAGFVRQALTLPKLNSRNRKEAVAYAIRELLVNSKRLLLDIGEDLQGQPYLAGDDHAIWPLAGELVPVRVMLAESGLNISEPAFTWLLGDLEKAAFLQGRRVCLVHFATRRKQTLYVSAGPRRMVKAMLDEQGQPVLRALHNGANKIYFAGDSVLPAWEPAPEPRPPSDLAAFNPALTTPPNLPAYTPAVQRLLLDAWLVAIIADIRPAPILAAIGQMDGGKTTLIKAICKLMLDTIPTSVSEDARDLWTLAVGLPLLGLDNVDSEPPPWLPDFLAALVTGVNYDRRKLYSNAVIDRRRARAVPLLSTRSGSCVARLDVAQRTLPLLTGEFQNSHRQSDKKILAEVEQHRSAVLTWLVRQAVTLLPRMRQAPAGLPSRFTDFAALLWAFDPDQAESALMALQQAQALVVGEEDRLLAAIIEYADELLGEMNYWHGRAKDLVAALDRCGAELPYLGGGKAIAFKLREGRGTLALVGLSLTSEHKSNTSYFTLRKNGKGI